MSKKNKDIEVRIEETEENINGKKVNVNHLFIGKKKVGTIVAKGSKNFEFEMTDGYNGVGKSLDEAIELVLRQWNLHDA